MDAKSFHDIVLVVLVMRFGCPGGGPLRSVREGLIPTDTPETVLQANREWPHAEVIPVRFANLPYLSRHRQASEFGLRTTVDGIHQLYATMRELR